MPERESWKNPGRATISITKFMANGQEQNEVVRAGGVINLTKQERQLNQDRAASPEQDLFRNGMLIPVRLIDGDEDVAEIAQNPNLLSDSELKAMFSMHYKTFEKKINEIGNAATLTRLYEMAEAEDATIRQHALIEDRLKEVDPTAVLVKEGTVTIGHIKGGKEGYKARGLSGDDERYENTFTTPR